MHLAFGMRVRVVFLPVRVAVIAFGMCVAFVVVRVILRESQPTTALSSLSSPVSVSDCQTYTAVITTVVTRAQRRDRCKERESNGEGLELHF